MEDDDEEEEEEFPSFGDSQSDYDTVSSYSGAIGGPVITRCTRQ